MPTNHKALLKDAEVRSFKADDFSLPKLPADGRKLLDGAAQRFADGKAAVIRRDKFDGDLELTSHAYATGPWYSDRQIQFLIWPGDLTVTGDLIDDDSQMPPILVVKGNLKVRSWLRGGMPAFVGGHVQATGFIVGHYNDSALFVGGDLTATGYLPRAKPYPDVPNVAPHQVAGKITARKLDVLQATEADLKQHFVTDVLIEDAGETYLDERAVLTRFAAGFPVWK